MRLIDADALIAGVKYSFYDDETLRVDTITDTLLTERCSPTIDAIPVVRCAKCTYAQLIDDKEPKYLCTHSKHERLTYLVDSGDFCSYGKQRGEKDEC